MTSLTAITMNKRLQYFGEEGEVGEVGEYLGDDGDICAGEVGES